MYGRTLTNERLRVQVPAPDTRWIIFNNYLLLKSIYLCLKRLEINSKRQRLSERGTFRRTNSIQRLGMAVQTIRKFFRIDMWSRSNILNLASNFLSACCTLMNTMIQWHPATLFLYIPSPWPTLLILNGLEGGKRPRANLIKKLLYPEIKHYDSVLQVTWQYVSNQNALFPSRVITMLSKYYMRLAPEDRLKPKCCWRRRFVYKDEAYFFEHLSRHNYFEQIFVFLKALETQTKALDGAFVF